jgi:hypothetical protein
MIRRLCLALLCLFGASTSLSAQWTAAVETGFGSTGFRSDPNAIATLSPSVSWTSSSLRLSAEGAYAGLGSVGYGAAGRFDASLFAPLRSWILAEGFVTATGVTGMDRVAQGAFLGGGRLHLRDPRQGLWVGAGPGREISSPTRRVEVGAWKAWGPLSLQLEGGQTAVHGIEVRSRASQDTLAPRQDTVVTTLGRTDMSGWLHWDQGRIQLGLGGGRRLEAGRSAGLWWESEATWWFTPRVALVGAAGNRPMDLTLGMTGGRYLLVAFRASLARMTPRPRSVTPRRVLSGLRVERLHETLVELRLPGRGARLVELEGDFTDWLPVTLTPMEEGWWSVVVPLSPGVHYLNVRFDGGAWEVPAGSTAVDDDFGGMVGMVRVP